MDERNKPIFMFRKTKTYENIIINAKQRIILKPSFMGISLSRGASRKHKKEVELFQVTFCSQANE